MVGLVVRAGRLPDNAIADPPSMEAPGWILCAGWRLCWHIVGSVYACLPGGGSALEGMAAGGSHPF